MLEKLTLAQTSPSGAEWGGNTGIRTPTPFYSWILSQLLCVHHFHAPLPTVPTWSHAQCINGIRSPGKSPAMYEMPFDKDWRFRPDSRKPPFSNNHRASLVQQTNSPPFDVPMRFTSQSLLVSSELGGVGQMDFNSQIFVLTKCNIHVWLPRCNPHILPHLT